MSTKSTNNCRALVPCTPSAASLQKGERSDRSDLLLCSFVYQDGVIHGRTAYGGVGMYDGEVIQRVPAFISYDCACQWRPKIQNALRAKV